MLWTTACALVLVGWTLVYALDVHARRRRLHAYLRFVERTGLVVHPMQLRWYTSGLQTVLYQYCFVDDRRVRRLLRLWFTVGAAAAVGAMVVITVYLTRTMALVLWMDVLRPRDVVVPVNASIDGYSSTTPTRQYDGLVPVIPGYNVPMHHMPLFVASLVLVGVVHELGHALAACAEKVHVNGFGLFIVLVYPGAFTEIDQVTLDACTPLQRLRIAAGGIWHNFVLALLAIGVLYALPYIASAGYMHGKGVHVRSVDDGSSVGGVSGLHDGDVVYAINDCKVYNAQSWIDCLHRLSRAPITGYCVPPTMAYEATVDSAHVTRFVDEISCCDNATSSHLCFYYTAPTSQAWQRLLPIHGSKNRNVTAPDSNQEYACLSARHVTDHFLCSPIQACGVRTLCVYPALFNSTALLRFAVANRTRPVLFVGSVQQVAVSVGVSSYVPRTYLLPPIIPDAIELLMKYVVAFSVALALLNAVPCYALDGQHMAQVFSDWLRLGTRGKYAFWLNTALIYGTCILLANVFVALIKFAT